MCKIIMLLCKYVLIVDTSGIIRIKKHYISSVFMLQIKNIVINNISRITDNDIVSIIYSHCNKNMSIKVDNQYNDYDFTNQRYIFPFK